MGGDAQQLERDGRAVWDLAIMRVQVQDSSSRLL